MSFFQSKIPIFKPRRSTQNLSRSNHLTSKMGKITPFMCEKNESGDRFSLGVLALGRTMPLFTPVMDQLTTKFAFYHITIRSIWDGFEDFITSASNYSLSGDLPPEIPQATMYDLVQVLLANWPNDGRPVLAWKGSQLDYFDYPWFRRTNDTIEYSSTAQTLKVSLLPLIAHAYIYHEDFVNENIQDVLDLREIRQLRGNITTWSDSQKLAFCRWVNWCQLFDVNWRKDYLTAAQPYTQKGMSVTLPLNVTIPDAIRLIDPNFREADLGKVLGLSAGGIVVANRTTGGGQSVQWVDPSTGQGVPARNVIVQGLVSPSGAAAASGDAFVSNNRSVVSGVDPLNAKYVVFNLRDSQGNPVELESGLTIEDLRTSSAIQRLLESMSVHGTRYNEYILGQYGVKISDHTLGLPHFIAGNSMPIQIGEVVQTSATETDSALGRFAGSGYQKGGAAGARYYAEEHGYIIGIMWTKPPTHYMWGVPRHLAELDPFEWMNPHFANLGQQEVFDYEAMREPEDPTNVFGYLQRYDHLRTSLDRVHGEMRDTLADWHLARNNIQVSLNSDFIKSQPDTRIFNVTDSSQDHLVHHLAIRCVVKRNIPRHANPKLL